MMNALIVTTIRLLFIVISFIGISPLAMAANNNAAMIYKHTNSSTNADAKNNIVYFFGTNHYPIVNQQAASQYSLIIKKYNLDAPENLKHKIANGLSENDMAAANYEANKRLQAIPVKKLQDMAISIALIRHFKIKKLPAFVFDNGESVIYGVSNATEALQRWSYYKSRGGIYQ